MRPLVASFRTLLALLFMMVACEGAGQEAGLNAPATPASEVIEFLGVDRCRSCHREATPEQVADGVTDFALLNESTVWISDVHSNAFELIDRTKSDLGKQICDRLGITDIHESRACLSCHSDWRPGLEKPPAYTRGVACESCHGASQKWDLPHSNKDWRAKPVADKKTLGMIDVRNPVARAERCFACHIGNAAEGKVITHEMYAAGHPPLPGIEIESFAQQMPRHWRYLDEKMADATAKHAGNEPAAPFKHFDEFLRENHRYLNPGEEVSNVTILGHHPRAAAVVLGGVVALRESIELLRDLAGGEESPQRVRPELASYDCRACHHELASPSWRQQQRAGLIPGRPLISSWPATLVRLSIRHLTADQTSYDKKLWDFQAKLAAVQAELQRTPFGSPSRVHKACAELSDWLTTELAEPASAKPFDDQAVANAVTLLIDVGSTELHDFDSARQIAWALRVLSSEDSTDDARGKKINEFLDTLAPQLRLELPYGPAHAHQGVSTDGTSRLAADLPSSLSASVDFDPALFRQQLQELRELLR